MSTLSITTMTQQAYWKFPKDRFVAYDKEDERWARPLGFGCKRAQMIKQEFPRVSLMGMTFDSEGRMVMECQMFPERASIGIFET